MPKVKPGSPYNEKRNQAKNRAYELYYIFDKTTSEIARELKVERKTIDRYLEELKKEHNPANTDRQETLRQRIIARTETILTDQMIHRLATGQGNARVKTNEAVSRTLKNCTDLLCDIGALNKTPLSIETTIKKETLPEDIQESIIKAYEERIKKKEKNTQ